jgi:CO/xanthine dehydrogenase Mo-binding subunit
MTRAFADDQPIPRKEGTAKVTGTARYVDDLSLPGMIYGTTVRSSVARGRLRGISLAPGIPWGEFTIVTARDIPGKNCVALILDDQPCLADQTINHAEEPVVLLAHPDRYLLEQARRAVQLEIEPMPAIFSFQDSLDRKEIIWGQDNILKAYDLRKGCTDPVWEKADFIVEGEYQTGSQEQLYIETQGMMATADSQQGVTVWGSMQCPFYVHKALMALFDLSKDKVRVIQAETGGGFGGKEEYPSMIAAHAALLAWKSGKPVKIIYDRSEDLAATPKRHPSRTRHRTAVSKDGRLLAMEIDFVIDGGAYATLSPVVLSRGTIHASGPYFCPNIHIRSQAVATNMPPYGAFRGFGAPQSLFAIERHMNRIARTIGLSPEELRRRNFLSPGQTTATSQVIRENIDLVALMEYAFQQSGYYQRNEQLAQIRTAPDDGELLGSGQLQGGRSPIRKGIGFATFMHGAGFTGAGEKQLASVAGVEATPAGRIRVLAASTEIGQGTNTIFSQMAAGALGVDCELIDVAQPDTADVPNSGPTVASRTCMIVGSLVESAAIGLKQTLQESGLLGKQYSSTEFQNACSTYVQRFGPLKTFRQYQQPPEIQWDDTNVRGDAYRTYAWAVYVAEVSVDLITFEVRVEDFVAVQDVGKVINPMLATGQIEGGIAQAIGFTLYENVGWKDGRMLNPQLTNYIIPTSADVPSIRVFFLNPTDCATPKGLGELPMDGPAPAILNAVEDALGVSVSRIPLLPETLMEATLPGKGAKGATESPIGK